MFCPRFSFYRLCFIVPRKDPRGQSIAAIHRELFLFSYIFWSACFMMTDSEISMFSRTIPPTAAVDSVVRRHDLRRSPQYICGTARDTAHIYSAGQSKSSSSRGRPRCCFHRSVSGLMHSADILDRRPAFPRCKRRPFFRSAQGPRRSPPRFFPISDHARGQRSVPSG